MGGSQGPDRLKPILRDQPVESARKEFRAGLKERFLAGEIAEQENEGLAGELHDSFAETLRTWEAPAPSPEFRHRMRGRFLEAEKAVFERAQESVTAPQPEPVPEAIPELAPQPEIVATQAPEPVRQVQARGSVQKKPGTLLTFWTPLAVAAALLVFFLGPKFLGTQKQPFEPNQVAWSLPDSLSDLEWTIDGETVNASDSAQDIEQRLSQAKSVSSIKGGGLRLAYGRYFQVEVADGSELDLSEFSQADSGTQFHLGMVGDSGGFYFQTGPDFKAQNCELTFQTPEAEIAVVGTVFAIDRYTAGPGMMEGTCVCCSEGNVRVMDSKKGHMMAPAGKSCFVMPAGKQMMPMDVVPDHQHPMDDLVGSKVPAGW